MIADRLTKALPGQWFKKFIKQLKLIDISLILETQTDSDEDEWFYQHSLNRIPCSSWEGVSRLYYKFATKLLYQNILLHSITFYILQMLTNAPLFATTHVYKYVSCNNSCKTSFFQYTISNLSWRLLSSRDLHQP